MLSTVSLKALVILGNIVKDYSHLVYPDICMHNTKIAEIFDSIGLSKLQENNERKNTPIAHNLCSDN